MIVSNNAEPAIEAFLDHHDLRSLVHTVIGRVPGRPELMKPHPDSVLRALDILDRPKAERTRRFLRRTLQLADSLEELTIDEGGVE